MKQTNTIRVDASDYILFRKECLDLFLEENPSMKGIRVSDSILFKSLVRYYKDE